MNPLSAARSSSLVVVVVIAAVACTPLPGPGRPGRSPRPVSPPPPPDPEPNLLTPPTTTELPGDVWIFVIPVEVQVVDPACRPAVDVDGRVFEAFNGVAFARVLPGPRTLRTLCLVDDAGGTPSFGPPVALVQRLEDRPRAQVQVEVVDEGVVLDGRGSLSSEGSLSPLAEFRWTALPGRPAPPGLPADGDLLPVRGALPLPDDTELFAALTVTAENGAVDQAAVRLVVQGGVVQPVDLDAPPADLRGAVVYGVVPHLFGEAGLPDVAARLDVLAELGVTHLWLAPLFAAPEGDYGYAVTDHFALREDAFEDDLHFLVDEAHGRGMKVLLDMVPNHTAAEHAYYDEARRTVGYYDDDPAFYFDWEHLPNLDFDQPEVRRMITEAFVRWVRDFDVDGYRIDVAWGVAERAPDFWPELRRALLRVKPDVVLLGETSARGDLSGLDLGYDWTDEPGRWAWQEAFDDPTSSTAATRLRAALEASRAAGGKVFRFLDNNDTGARFVDDVGEEAAAVARVMLFTLPGVPGLFTGDEVDARYEPYLLEEPLDFTADPARFAELAALVALRRAHPALTGPDLALLPVVDDEVVAYARPAVAAARGTPGGPGLLVLLRFGPGEGPVVVEDVAALLGAEGGVAALEDARTLQPVPVDEAGAVTVELPAFGAVVLAVP